MSGNLVEIRKADADDLEGIIGLWEEVREYHEELDERYAMVENARELVREYYREKMDSDNAIFFLATANGKKVGFIMAYATVKPPVYKEREMGFIDTLMVTKRFRRMGVGSRLVAHVRDWFLQRGINQLQLSVAALNSNGIAFWEKLGFRELSRRLEREY